MAGESLRDLKRRIKSVQSTKQITRAMEMVAAAKLRRAEQRLRATRPYASKIRDMLANLSAAAGSVDHPLLESRPDGGRTAIIFFSADRGLAGSFNVNLIRDAERTLRKMNPDDVRLIMVGKKGNDYFRRRKYPIVARYLDAMGGLDVKAAEEIAQIATDLFLSGEVNKVVLLYQAFISTMTYKITWETLLPIAAPAAAEGAMQTDYIFEPGPAEILGALLPRFLTTRVLIAMAESQTSEQGSRMISMGSATKNAGELISALTLKANRARQAAITKELAEIVGGAEALK